MFKTKVWRLTSSVEQFRPRTAQMARIYMKHDFVINPERRKNANSDKPLKLQIYLGDLMSLALLLIILKLFSNVTISRCLQLK